MTEQLIEPKLWCFGCQVYTDHSVLIRADFNDMTTGVRAMCTACELYSESNMSMHDGFTDA